MPSINDNFADAIDVSIASNGDTYTSASLDTAGNTTETNEPAVSASSTVSAWWKYTPTSSGTADFDTQLSTPTTTGTDTYMAIWTGTALTNLVNVAADDDGGGSGTSFVNDLAVTAGTTYWIQVGGFGTQTMNLVLRVTGPATSGGGGGGSGDVIAVPATASASALPPSSVSGESVLSGGGPATASAQALAPTVVGGAGGDGQVFGVLATASAQALSPNVSDGVVVPSTVAQGESRADNAKRRLNTAGYTGTLQDMQRKYLRDIYGGPSYYSVADLQIHSAGLDQVYDILPDAILPVDA